MSLLNALHSLLHAVLAPLFAWRYDAHAEPPALTAKRRELVHSLPRAARVLEVGAGTGATLSSGAYDAAPPHLSRVVLSEPDPAMRARLEARLRHRRAAAAAASAAASAPAPAPPAAADIFTVSDAALPSLPFDDASFDAVTLFFVASHLDARPRALAEIARVLEPGGTLLFIDHGVHQHPHPHGHAHGRGHNRGAADTGPGQVAVPMAHARAGSFWEEWFRWMRRGGHQHTSLHLLLEDFRAETALEESFTGIIETPNYFFKEVAYGCFIKKPNVG